MPRHHTSLSLSPSTPQLVYRDNLMAIGSCFAQNLGQQLQKQLYNILLNPFGVLYNPSSISKSLQFLLEATDFEEHDLLPHRDAWHSLYHHSSFSGTDKIATLNHINTSLHQAREHLQQTRCLFLTFGTAWVYTWKASGQIVSNCHHFPAAQFERRRLSVQEIVNNFLQILPVLKERHHTIEIILTISPIRHLKDGFVENQVSKATLVLAVQQLVEQLDYCHYFPAYEMVLDDLRDYRYYGPDLIHPNALAIDYIWQAFEAAHLAQKEQLLRKQVAKLQQAANHRPRQIDGASHQAFLKKQLLLLEKLTPQLPEKTCSLLKMQFLTQVL
ncbi:MAG: GSCFA domain-containing protein [Aureispira sp.]